MSKTASYVKDRYNSKTYDRYTFYIRKDEMLNDTLQESIQTQSVGQIAKDALTMFFDEKTKTHPGDNTRTKTNKSAPDYSTKRQRRAAIKKIIKQLQHIRDAEERSRDNMPESFQSSPAYEVAEECIAALDEVIEQLDSTY